MVYEFNNMISIGNLQDFSLPSTMSYLVHTESILIQNSGYNLETYPVK